MGGFFLPMQPVAWRRGLPKFRIFFEDLSILGVDSLICRPGMGVFPPSRSWISTRNFLNIIVCFFIHNLVCVMGIPVMTMFVN